MDIPSNIFLIGPMGVGKSTVARRLATALHKKFIDADREIERRAGVDISRIFELETESGFRARESALLAELVKREGIVLATGGGVVLSASNRASLVNRGFVVYLQASLDLLMERVSRNRRRPLMHTDDPRETMRAIIHIRDPLYYESADIVVRSVKKPVRRIVDEILKQIEAL